MTLIEILTVMSIMVILISAVVVSYLSLSRKGPKEGTNGLLQQLAQGLAQYKTAYRMYVPVDNVQPLVPGTGSPPAPWWPYVTLDIGPSATLQMQASTFALWEALENDGQYVSVKGDCKGAGGKFSDPKTGAPTTWYYYQDAWGTPIRYQSFGLQYNQFTLISAGEDRTFGTGDDISLP